MNVFTYGSLMFPAVWNRVVSGDYHARPARLAGHRRRRIIGEVYPALVPGAIDEAVEGVLYVDLSPRDLVALDRFEGEGEAYRRVEVSVTLGNGERHAAWAYRYTLIERVSDEPWDRGWFEREGLAAFLATYCRDRVPDGIVRVW